MYNYEDILARLRNGEDAEVIAQEMAETLNKANRDFVDEKEKADNQKQRKAEAVKNMMGALAAYVREFHPENPINESFAKADINKDIDEVVNMIDSAIEEMGMLSALTKAIGPDLERMIKAHKSAAPVPDAAKNVNPIDAFLKANHLA